ncbi:MAG: hypothetical protein SFW66_03245 [Gammaproteobacteria bacterium]|nr:hypothetical protein [Gammaproteobacteria bacterium]
MYKKLFSLIALILLILPYSIIAAGKTPVMIVAPFSQSVTLAQNSSANVNIVVQNNTGVNLTITQLTPLIPSGSPVTVNITDNTCGLLAPQESCEATAHLNGLTKPGNENLNISVCAFNGTLCSRISEPVTVENAPLVALSITPTKVTPTSRPPLEIFLRDASPLF